MRGGLRYDNHKVKAYLIGHLVQHRKHDMQCADKTLSHVFAITRSTQLISHAAEHDRCRERPNASPIEEQIPRDCEPPVFDSPGEVNERVAHVRRKERAVEGSHVINGFIERRKARRVPSPTTCRTCPATPVQITDHVGDSSAQALLAEVLLMTKMNCDA